MHWNVGDVRVTRVVEREVTIPLDALLPGLTPEVIDGLGEWASSYFTPDHQMHLSIHSFVVDAPDALVVVDTCVGAHAEQLIPGDEEFGDRLEAVLPGGFDSVDAVVCTHLHFDHVGWNTRIVDGRFQPTFAHARYLVSHDELAATQADDHMNVMASSVQPLLDAGVLDAVEPDHRIGSSVRLVPSAGHSPGHVCVRIDSAGESGLITGDSFHSAAQIAHPELASSADFDPVASTATRRELLADLADTDTRVFGTHFAPPTAGLIRTAAAQYWFDGHRPHD